MALGLLEWRLWPLVTSGQRRVQWEPGPTTTGKTSRLYRQTRDVTVDYEQTMVAGQLREMIKKLTICLTRRLHGYICPLLPYINHAHCPTPIENYVIILISLTYTLWVIKRDLIKVDSLE